MSVSGLKKWQGHSVEALQQKRRERVLSVDVVLNCTYDCVALYSYSYRCFSFTEMNEMNPYLSFLSTRHKGDGFLKK